VLKVFRELHPILEQLGKPDQLACKEFKVCKVIVVSPVCKEFRAQVETKARKGCKACKVIQAPKVVKVCKDLRVLRVFKGQLVRKEFKDTKESREIREQLV